MSASSHIFVSWQHLTLLLAQEQSMQIDISICVMCLWASLVTQLHFSLVGQLSEDCGCHVAPCEWLICPMRIFCIWYLVFLTFPYLDPIPIVLSTSSGSRVLGCTLRVSNPSHDINVYLYFLNSVLYSTLILFQLCCQLPVQWIIGAGLHLVSG